MELESELESKGKVKVKKDMGVQVIIDNGWNDYKIKQLKRKCQELKIYQYLHKDASSYYKKLHQKLFLPQTSIMTISTGTLFVSLSDKVSDVNRYWINLFVSFFTLIGSVLSIWVKFFNAEQKYNDHLNASKSYSLIIDNIEEQIGSENDEKEDYHIYMSKIRKMINDQKQISLDIEQQFWDKYFKLISRGELIMMNQSFLDEQISKELSKSKKMSLSLSSNITNHHKNINESIIQINNEHNNDSNNVNDNENNNVNDNENNIVNDNENINTIDNNNNSTNSNNIEHRKNTYEYVFNFDNINTNDLKKKLMYQLQRNL